MPVKSLVDLCLNTILKNINLVSGIGDELPHDNRHVQKILARIPTAAQLREVEVNSPQLQGHTAKYWKAMIHRDFPTARKKNYVPSDPAGWWKVYKRYKREHEESLRAATAALQSAFAGLAKEESGNVATIVDGKRLPRPPRTGTGRRIGAPRSGQRQAGSSTLAFTAGSRTKLVSGKNVLRRARREAKDIAAQRGSLGAVSRVSNAAGGQLRAAPTGFIEHHRVASQPEFRKSLPPTSSRPTQSSNTDAKVATKRKREDPECVVINVSEEDDSDDLFGEESDGDRPPAKVARLGSGRRQNTVKREPLFDDDGGYDDNYDGNSYSVSRKNSVSKTQSSRPLEATRVSLPLKRPSAGLLPGKPGFTRFMKSTSSSRPSASSPPPKPSATLPAMAKVSNSSTTPSKLSARPRAESPPQQLQAAAASQQSPDVAFPRKRKPDIFMKPRKRT